MQAFASGAYVPEALFTNTMKLILDARGLAEAISLPVRTVQQYASRYPDKLPPRLNLPNRKLLWAMEDVQQWVQRHRPAVSEQALQE